MEITNKKADILAGIGLVVRIYLGMVFILASLYKIYEPYEFGISVATYQMVPLYLINIFVIILPFAEFIIGLALVLGFWTKENSILIAGMMLMFLVALIAALQKELNISCGCFASQKAIDEISVTTVFRDLIWLFMALYVFFFDDGRFGIDRFLRKKA